MPDDLEARALARQWFYRFDLPSGRRTDTYVPPHMQPVHATRAAMMREALVRQFGPSLAGRTAIDLACHEGWFAHQLVALGCERVLGLDAREEHVRHATLMRDIWGLEQLSFRQGDVQALDPAALGVFDVTLMFGVVYHLENVVGALRRARAMTRTICLIETQLAPDLSGRIEWGAQDLTKPVLGCLALIDETDELSTGNAEANLTPITLLPSLPALTWLLRAVGFRESYVVAPPPDAYEQFARGKRVVVAALA